MKHSLYTLMVLCAFGLLSCRKSSDDFTIKQYDADKIQSYIKANGLTGMVKDTSGGDTTGIYYQIISPGVGRPIAYSDKISYVYTARSFDGGYTSADTIFNHVNAYAAYVSPNGLQLAIKNIMKRKGAKIRVLIPSRLAYGTNGSTLSSFNTLGATVYGTVGGNQCMDYVVSVMDDDLIIVNDAVTPGKKDTISKQSFYDDISIQKYLAANGLTGFTKTPSGMYYKVTQVGTGTDVIGLFSTLGLQYTGSLFNTTVFESHNSDDGLADAIVTLIEMTPDWQEILPKVTAGAKLTFITPSGLGYGQSASVNSGTNFTLPAFSCLRYDVNVISVTN
jgi:FKBP-type peptidyl-prolyl cis-trans isomerase FkpA